MSKNDSFPLPTIEDSTIIMDRFFTIKRDKLRYEGHHSEDYFTLETRSSAVVVVATVSTNEFILVEEYRHATKKIIFSLPGGYLEGDEDPIVAAKRELLEETGYAAKDFKVIGSTFAYPGISNQKLVFVGATEAFYQQSPVLEPAEVLCSCIKSRDAIEEMIAKGEAIDSSLLAGLYLKYHNMRR